MLYDIKLLEERSQEDLFTLFSVITKADDSLQLEGDFTCPSAKIERTLGYLPRHIISIRFVISSDVTPADGSSIGCALQNYVRAIPFFIRSVGFEFSTNNDSSLSADDFVETVKSLPSTVTHVEIDGKNFTRSFLASSRVQRRAIFKNMPDSVQSLVITGMKTQHNALIDKEIIHSVNPHTKRLSLQHCNMHQLVKNDGASFFTRSPRDLNYLNLSFNRLFDTSAQNLSFFLAKTSASIKWLSLRGNELARFSISDLVTIASSFPSTLKILDISDNYLLRLELADFALFLDHLSVTITSLGIKDNDVIGLTPEEIGAHYALLPRHIKCVIFSHINLRSVSFSLDNFVKAWSYLPATVEEIDLSSNDFDQAPVEIIQTLLQNLPASVRKVKMRDNGLSLFTLADIKAIFLAFRPNIIELDISMNGLNRLSNKKIERILSYVPPTVKYLITGSNELERGHDGAIMPCIGFFQQRPARQEKRFYNKQEFANLRVVMMQFLMQGQLANDLMYTILSYVFVSTNPAELNGFLKELSKLIISSKPPEIIEDVHEKECLLAVSQRIAERRLSDNVLDLSRCGLNRLISKKSQDHLIDLLTELPRTITHLKLSSNGFGYNEGCLEVFIKLAYRFPATLRHLDLGDNKIEYLSAANLKAILHYLPPGINEVILDHGEALSPAEQIKKREWPASFDTLTSHTDNRAEKALILFNDYSKWDSTFLLLLSGHWGRKNTKSAAKISHLIEEGMVDDENLDEHLSEYKPANKLGCFALRLSYLTYNRSCFNQPVLDRSIIANSENSEDTVECCC